MDTPQSQYQGLAHHTANFEFNDRLDCPNHVEGASENINEGHFYSRVELH